MPHPAQSKRPSPIKAVIGSFLSDLISSYFSFCLFHSGHTGLLAIPLTCRAYSCLRSRPRKVFLFFRSLCMSPLSSEAFPFHPVKMAAPLFLALPSLPFLPFFALCLLSHLTYILLVLLIAFSPSLEHKLHKDKD